MKAQSKRWLKAGGTAGLLVIALAGCGGGGSDDPATGGGTPAPAPAPGPGPSPAPAPSATAAVSFPGSGGIAFAGTPKTVSVAVIDNAGNPVTGKTVVFTSSNPAVASVSGTGQEVVIDPKVPGVARITATVDGRADTLDLVIQAAAPTTLAEYKNMFPEAYTVTNGLFVVKSDISREYSQKQLDQMVNGWELMASKYVVTPGTHVEMYYSWDRSIVDVQGGAVCPSALAALPVRTLRSCFDTVNVLLVAPNLDAKGAPVFDYATGLATVSQLFADQASPLIYEWPWLYDGLAVAFKSGSFAATGGYTTYRMGNLVQPELGNYKAVVDSLLPLSGDGATDLVDLTRGRPGSLVGDTWGPNATVAFPQSGMLLNYLYREKPAAVDALIRDLVAGTVTTSQQAFDRILAEAGLTVEQLDIAYKAHGAAQ
jgi:hypothetical protein